MATWSVPAVLFAVCWGAVATAALVDSAAVTVGVAVVAGIALGSVGVLLVLRAGSRLRGLGAAIVAGAGLATVLGVWLALS